MSHCPTQDTGKRDSNIHTKKKKRRTACRGEINQIENKVAVEMIKKTKSKTMIKKRKRKNHYIYVEFFKRRELKRINFMQLNLDTYMKCSVP